MKWSYDNIQRIAQFIAAFCNKEGVMHSIKRVLLKSLITAHGWYKIKRS
jgi:hypothetical protein